MAGREEAIETQPAQKLQRRGERRATINEELWGGVYVRERFISQSEHTPKYVY